MRWLAAAMAVMLAAAAGAQAVQRSAPAAAPSGMVDLRGQKAPAAVGKPYAARNLPDRIILSPGADPSTEMSVAWRTDRAQASAEAEIAELVPAPNFGLAARRATGQTIAALSENGGSHHHQLRFTGLKPDTAYAYRLKGAAGFGEWHQFRTAAADKRPFRFLYMGDTQNQILEIGSLAWRRALLQAGNPALMLHAGDLVASRDDMVHDDEWGEWTASGGWAIASVPQVPAAGNHEYVDVTGPDGREAKQLGPHWPLTFALPANGVESLKQTTYSVDWQGVRFLVLDGTSALEHKTAEQQARWLDARLAESRAIWNIVLFHQPLFTCARPGDTPALIKAWKPVFDRHRVDLVLQGHDHCYSRLTDPRGRDAGAKARADGNLQGPVYLVSVAGAKMYGLNDRSGSQPDRVAEDTSLFQIVDVAADRLLLRSYLNSGVLYDGFDLVRQPGGGNRLEELPDALPTVRRCSGPPQLAGAPMPPGRKGPDGLPCTADMKG